MIGRPAIRRTHGSLKAKTDEVQFIDKDVDHTNRAVIADPIFQLFGKQRDLIPIHALDKTLHLILPPQGERITKLKPAKDFSHSQGQNAPASRAKKSGRWWGMFERSHSAIHWQ